MLTDMQKGGIRSCLELLFRDAKRYFRIIEQKNDIHEKIEQLLKKAMQDNYTGERYDILSSRVSLKDALPIITYELWGIIHADWGILNRLTIINGFKDPVKFTEESLKKTSHEIKEFAQNTAQILVETTFKQKITSQPEGPHHLEMHAPSPV